MVKLMQEYLLVNSKLLFIALQVFTKVKWNSVTKIFLFEMHHFYACLFRDPSLRSHIVLIGQFLETLVQQLVPISCVACTLCSACRS